MPIVLDGSNGVTLPGASTGVQVGALTRSSVFNVSGNNFVEYTDLPSWIKRITILFAGVSTNGTANPVVQIGTSAGIVSSGYLGSASTGAGTSQNISSGFVVSSANAGADIMHGTATLATLDGLTWCYSSAISLSNQAATRFSAGSITLGTVLTRVRLTTHTGGDAYDAGRICIMWD